MRNKMMHGMRSSETNNHMANVLREEKGDLAGEPTSMKEAMDLTEVIKLEEGKHERFQLIMQQIKKQRAVNFKSYRQNNASRLRNQEIARKSQQQWLNDYDATPKRKQAVRNSGQAEQLLNLWRS